MASNVLNLQTNSWTHLKRFGAFMALIAMISGTALAAADKTETSEDAKKTVTKEVKKAVEKKAAPKKSKSEDELIADLSSADANMQIAAARALGAKKSEKALPELVTLLGQSKDRDVLWNAVMAVGMIAKGGTSTDTLLSLSTGSKHKTVRYAALVSLGNILLAKKMTDEQKATFKKAVEWTRDNSDDEFAKDLASGTLKKLSGKSDDKKAKPTEDKTKGKMDDKKTEAK